ncbi:YheT family hydrolase, partial [Xanthomonas campestris]
MDASDYQPPRWLRNPHVQSGLGSSALRRIRSRQVLAGAGARASAHILGGGGGVRVPG